MGTHAKALALPAEFPWRDRTWKLTPWTYQVMGEYEQYLQDSAFRTMKRMRKHLSEVEYASLTGKTREDVDSGKYNFDGEVCRRSLDVFANFAYITYLCLREHQPDVTYDLARELLKEEGELVVEKFRELNSDPNPKTPASP